jgi:hypothetical protein
MTTDQITVGDLSFAVRRSSRRRSLEIVVERDGALTLLAPAAASTAAMKSFAREKRLWIYGKLAKKESLYRPPTAKEFVSGEGFPYLGKTYRLLLVDQQDVPLTLKGGRFRLLKREAHHGRQHFVDWYRRCGEAWLQARVAPWARQMGVKPKQLTVRDLGYRWGSCGKGGSLNFHWAAMTLPPSVLDYLIVHELAHISVPGHGRDFWRRVATTLPDYEQRREWLGREGARTLVPPR